MRVLADGVDAAVLAGDPNQAVFGFRGADAATLLDDEGPAVRLTVSHRCAPAVARAVSGVAGLLPGHAAGRTIEGHADGEPGRVETVLAASEHAEAAVVADALLRAHLIDGVPWSEMAVIVRSVPRAGAGSSCSTRSMATGCSTWPPPVFRWHRRRWTRRCRTTSSCGHC